MLNIDPTVSTASDVRSDAPSAARERFMIPALETGYAGCRFRSRLEARWAVFFDHLGVDWHYEPEPYLIDGVSYLPDFWLPQPQIWVEVKGDPQPGEIPHLIAAAGGYGLPCKYDTDQRPDAADPATWGPRLLVLGNVPRPKVGWSHRLLSFYGGHVFSGHAFIANTDPDDPEWLQPFGRSDGPGDLQCYIGWVHGCPQKRLVPSMRIDAAYAAARSARFEFGQSGATGPLPRLEPGKPLDVVPSPEPVFPAFTAANELQVVAPPSTRRRKVLSPGTPQPVVPSPRVGRKAKGA